MSWIRAGINASYVGGGDAVGAGSSPRTYPSSGARSRGALPTCTDAASRFGTARCVPCGVQYARRTGCCLVARPRVARMEHVDDVALVVLGDLGRDLVPKLLTDEPGHQPVGELAGL